MPLSYQEFLNEIAHYKKLHGFVSYDDNYRKRFWLPYLPVGRSVVLKKKLRQKFDNANTEPRNDIFHAISHEKPSRVVENGFILGVGKHVPRYINRDSAVAKEFQGARINVHLKIQPAYPYYIPPATLNYLIRRNSLLHDDCLDVGKDSATLWRDLSNADLDCKIISGIPRWYHPLVASAKKRFDQRWPYERKIKYQDLYFNEFCKLFHRPTRIFAPDWRDEQLMFPYEDYTKVCTCRAT